MLTIGDLNVRYGVVHAVKGLSLEIGTREVVGLLGANGAGKSSTLRALSRLVPYTGTVVFDGTDFAHASPENTIRLGLVHVPEGRRLFAGLTVHENLLMGEAARFGRTVRYSMDDVYDLFPALRPLRRRSAWALSGGEQQMVAIGRALLAAPRMLLLDEPSLGLSPKLTHTVFSTLGQIARDTPMLLVEQQTTLALRICSRAAVMAAGEVVLAGTAAELTDRSALLDSLLGQSRAHRDVVSLERKEASDSIVPGGSGG